MGLRLKGCPRCVGGDVAVDRDEFGWYESCLQCGYLKDLVKVEMGRFKENPPIGKNYRRKVGVNV